MCEIAIMTGSDMLQTGMAKVIQEHFPEHYVASYHANQEELFYVENHAFDLIIVGMNPSIHYLDLIHFSLKKDIKLAVWASENENERLRELFKLGLQGYLYNGMTANELTFAIKNMLDGLKYIHPGLTNCFIQDYLRKTSKKENRPANFLTNREWEVLELIVKGKNNNAIADILCISPKTVKNHVATILRKLRVPDRTNAALLAVKNKWYVL